MRPTPRTDAAIESPMRPDVLLDAVNIARALERELNELLEAAQVALNEMTHTVAPRDSFTNAVDALDAAIAKATGEQP